MYNTNQYLTRFRDYFYISSWCKLTKLRLKLVINRVRDCR